MGIHVIKSTVAPSAAPTILQVGAHWVKTTNPKGQWFAVGSDTVADWIDQSAIAGAVAKTGGTMTGPLKVPQTAPTDSDDVVATKKYVDDKVASGGGGGGTGGGGGAVGGYRIYNYDNSPYIFGYSTSPDVQNTILYSNPWATVSEPEETFANIPNIFSNFDNKFPGWFPVEDVGCDLETLVHPDTGLTRGVVMFPLVVHAQKASKLNYVMMSLYENTNYIEAMVWKSDPVTNLPDFYNPISRASSKGQTGGPWGTILDTNSMPPTPHPNQLIYFFCNDLVIPAGSTLFWVGWDIGEPGTQCKFVGLDQKWLSNSPLGNLTHLIWTPRDTNPVNAVNLDEAFTVPPGTYSLKAGGAGLNHHYVGYPTEINPTSFIKPELIDDDANGIYYLSASFRMIGNISGNLTGGSTSPKMFIPWIGYNFSDEPLV